MAPYQGSFKMKPEWAQRHMETTFKNCKKNTLELAPAAFPSLPIDQPRPEPPRSFSSPRWWRKDSDSDDWTSTSSRSPHSPRNPRRKRRSLSPRQNRGPRPRQARDPFRRKHRSPPPKTARQNAPCVSKALKAQKINGTGLVFAPSVLRDPQRVHIVNRVTWNTIEFWYALPPVDLRKAGRTIQGEHDRLQEAGTLQQRAFRPKMDSEREFTTLEQLVNQRKMLQTKLQILKYETARLLNPKKPSILAPALCSMDLQSEEQRLREENRRLALEINDLLEQVKSKQHASVIPLFLPRKGVFTSPPTDRTGLAAVGDQGLGQTALADLRGESKAPSGRAFEPVPSKDSLDWPVPEDMAEFGGSDATDWDTPDDDSNDEDLPKQNLPEQNATELREVSGDAWDRRPTPPPSQSSTSSEAADTEAVQTQLPPPTPQTSKRKSNTGDFQDSASKRRFTPSTSESSDSFPAAKTEARNALQPPPIPHVSRRKAEAGFPHEPPSKRHIFELARLAREIESQPPDPQAPSPERRSIRSVSFPWEGEL